MLLSDLSALRLVARPAAMDYLSAATATKSVETGDPELDRMYNQSPVITEFAATYQPDVYKTEGDKEGQGKNEDGGQASKVPLFSKKFFKGKPNDWKAEGYFS